MTENNDKLPFPQTLAELLAEITSDNQHEEIGGGMELNAYQELSARTANTHANELTNYGLGIAGEAGEIADLIKKSQFHGHDVDKAEVKKELGDVLWYLSQIARVSGLSLEEIAEANIDKLRARYPEGFSQSASINRKEGR